MENQQKLLKTLFDHNTLTKAEFEQASSEQLLFSPAPKETSVDLSGLCNTPNASWKIF
jgi:hypothetical protein